MKDTHKQLIEQLSQLQVDGLIDQSIQPPRQEYKQLQDGEAVLVSMAIDFENLMVKYDNEIGRASHKICQLLISAYSDAKHQDPETAFTFSNSFISDYPNVPESSLLPRCCSLIRACLATRLTIKTDNPSSLLAWQQTFKQFQAYNEFLNGLFPYLIILLRTTLKKQINVKVFDDNYSNKRRQITELTNGEDGDFHIFTYISRPRLRNAIAHETAWLDSKEMVVRFSDGRGEKRIESEIDVNDFAVLANMGSHLAHAYLSAISVIAIMESGSSLSQSLLPKSLSGVLLNK